GGGGGGGGVRGCGRAGACPWGGVGPPPAGKTTRVDSRRPVAGASSMLTQVGLTRSAQAVGGHIPKPPLRLGPRGAMGVADVLERALVETGQRATLAAHAQSNLDGVHSLPDVAAHPAPAGREPHQGKNEMGHDLSISSPPHGGLGERDTLFSCIKKSNVVYVLQ